MVYGSGLCPCGFLGERVTTMLVCKKEYKTTWTRKPVAIIGHPKFQFKSDWSVPIIFCFLHIFSGGFLCCLTIQLPVWNRSDSLKSKEKRGKRPFSAQPIPEVGTFVPFKKTIIRTHLRLETGSDDLGLVREAGVELATQLLITFYLA